jgi:hypothetical protein
MSLDLPTPNSNLPPASAGSLPIGVTVRVTGGKYNGYQGTLVKACDTVGSIIVDFDTTPHELVVDLAHLQSLTAWRAARTATELSLRGSG